MDSKAALFAVGLLTLLGCPEERAPKDVGAQLERQLKERVDQERQASPVVPAPSQRSPNLARLSATSNCQPKLAIPLFSAVAPNVCFGQTPSEVKKAWSAATLEDPSSPFSRASFEFDDDALAAVVLEPVNSDGMPEALWAVLTAALGKPTTYAETSAHPWFKPRATTYWYEEGVAHAYFRRTTKGPEPVTIWKPTFERDQRALQRYNALIAADEARKAAEPKHDGQAH